MNHLKTTFDSKTVKQSNDKNQPKTASDSKAKIDKQALAKRFLQLGKPEQIKFIELLSSKGLDFEKLPIVSVGHEQQVELSPAQQRLWDIYCLDKGNSAYHMSGTFYVKGHLDIERLSRIVNQVLQRHDVLRTRFITNANESVVQFVDTAAVMCPLTVDAQSWSQDQIQESQREFIAKAFELEIDLPIRMQCLQLSESSWKLQLVMHHIVSDGWSIGVFLNELITLYQQGHLPELPIQYRDYSHWQSALLEAGKGQQHIDFWKNELGEADSHQLFPWYSEIAPNQRRIAESISYELSELQSQKIKQIARQLSVTTSSLWLGIWQAALAKVTHHTDISVGVPMANRTRHEVSNLIGFFVNTMVIQQSISPSCSLSQAIEGAHNKVLEAQEHQLLPFDQLVQTLANEQRNIQQKSVEPTNSEPKGFDRKAGQTPLFQVLFNHQHAPADNIQLDNQLTLSAEQQNGEFALFDIALDVRESERKTRVVLTYSKDRIDQDNMVELNAVLEQLVSELESNIDRSLAQISRLTTHDASVLERLSQPEGEWTFHSIIELIAKQVKEQPDAIALKHQDIELSYKQLDSASSLLASKLVASNLVDSKNEGEGVYRDQAIGVLFERGVEMIVAMVAVMKAGGAFLPLDPDYPTERLTYMIQDSKAKFVITQKGLESRWQNIQSEFDVSSSQASPLVVGSQDLKHSLNDLDEKAARDQEDKQVQLEATILPEQLAYIIYTSGSTGKPKGVAINHVGLSMHVQTIGKQYGMTPEDVELHFASISFDGAVERWTVPLAFGSKLVIRDQELWSAEKTCEVLCDDKITIACFPPSYVGPLLDWIEYQKPLLNVRSWTLGGEAFTAETYQRLQKLVNPPRIINGYGPTETVVTPMIWCAYPKDNLNSAYAPIGQPVGERRLYVLDAQLNKVAFGKVGELYIGGEVGLARGYLEQPDLTSERFIPDPFNTNDTTSRDSSHERVGQRMYRTGDLVRWNHDGVMEYIGRVDQQVKIRGFRVELGEIESRLQALSKVEHCVVAVKEVGQQKQLFGYLQSSEPDRFDLDDILEALSRELPDYMVPNQLMVMDRLPLTPAGKVDRTSLPDINMETQLVVALVSPKTEQEVLLVKLWQQLLGIEDVSCTDNFFALGGDSILCLQMVSKVRVAGYNLTPQQVFDAKSLCDLAGVLEIHKAKKERDLTTESFGLMPIQAHFLAQQFPQPDHWNQHICVELKQDMNTSYLESAIQALVKQHPSLRLAFNQHQGRWNQQFQDFQVRDYLWVSKVESEPAFSAFSQEIHQSMDIGMGRLIQAGYAEFENAPNRLMIAIHHLAVDGVSWRILLDDLWKAYQQQVAGQTIELMPNSSAMDEAVHSLEEWSSTEQGKLMQEAWHESSVTSNDSAQDKPPALHQDKQVFKAELSNELTQTLLRISTSALAVDIQSVLITALVSTLANKDQPDVLIYLEGHGRESSVFSNIDLSRMVGWTTSLYPMVGRFQTDILSVLSSTSEYLESVKKDGGIGYGLRYLSQDCIEQSKASVTFNYLGQYSSDDFAHWCSPIEEGSLPQSGLNSMLTPLVVNSQVVAGKLSLSWEFATTHYSLAEIEQFTSRFIDSLNALVAASQVNDKSATGQLGRNRMTTRLPEQCISDTRLVEKLNTTSDEHEPLFCIHPVTGRVTGYQRLAQALEGDRSVFGIKSNSFVSDNIFDSSFADMADAYYQTIKQMQPCGPYRLVGWSLGGALAQEIASRLEANGDEIAFIGLLDCYVPGTEIAEDQWDSPTSKSKLLEHLSLLLGPISEQQGQRCLRLLDSVPPPMWPEAFNTWLAENQFDRYMADNAKQMLYSWSVEQHMRALCHEYQLPSIKTQLHCWWAGLPSGRSELLSKGLNKHNKLQYSVVVDTDHLGVVQNNTVIKGLYRHLYCE
ncbi:amino acid adenylation domain-containing protein [Vibrio echinoideorum]|uniref:Amino acid adenylation domain-containing protein n=1 Tax=Vibrio echinoideorum TaxID=2100116 RepID=A0ABU9FRS9_9VIBR